MTCIVAIVNTERSEIHMGGDSAFSSGYSIAVRPNQKVFINQGFLIGCAGSVRTANLMRFKFTPPQPTQSEMFDYLVTGFVESLRDCLKSAGNTTKSDEFEYIHGQMLVGFYGRLFLIDGDMQVCEITSGYEAIGSGAEVALGSLYSTPRMNPRKRIETALEASANFNASVRGPWQIERFKWPKS